METHTTNNFMIWSNSNSDCGSNGGLDAGNAGTMLSGSNMVKCEKSLNFATGATSEEDEYGFHDRRKMSRDPMSHRIIEKRRRDRMNNCLADLSRLIPADYLKKGRGRIEKTEIIEMAIKHMKYLHSVVCSRTSNSELPLDNSHLLDNYDQDNKVSGKEESTEHSQGKSTEPSSPEVTEIEPVPKPDSENGPAPINLDHFKLGFQECLSESMHYLVEVKGYYPGSSLCMQLICHLQKHCDKILRGDRLNKPRAGDSTSTSNSPNSSKPNGPGSSSSDSCERVLKQEPNEPSYDRDQYDTPGQPQEAHTSHQTPYDRALALYAPPSPHQSDHLTKPNLSLFNIEQEHAEHPDIDRMMIENYPTDTSPCPSTSADHSLYKFKNNIKQRFTAEHSSSGYISAPPTKKSKSSETTAKYEDSPCNDSPCSNDYPSDLSRHCDSGNRSVAIFALHGDGTFYIPLTVDYSALAPYLGAYSLRRSSRKPPPVLHPVTLSVCFQQNGPGFTRHTSHTVSGASSDFGRSSLVKVHK